MKMRRTEAAKPNGYAPRMLRAPPDPNTAIHRPVARPRIDAYTIYNNNDRSGRPRAPRAAQIPDGSKRWRACSERPENWNFRCLSGLAAGGGANGATTAAASGTAYSGQYLGLDVPFVLSETQYSMP